MQVKTQEAGLGIRHGVRRFLLLAVSVSLAGWGCGGSDSGPTDPPNNPPPPPPAGTSTFSGSWDTTDLDEVGTPSSRYIITQNGGTLTGDAYWRWRGVLERIGPITGTIAADGSFEWTAVMNDNGWDGTETVTGKFTGSSGAVSGFATLSSAGTPIQWKWFAPDGSLREEGFTQLDNLPTVFPTGGEGPLAEVGLWRGAVLFSSPGNCNSQGFAWTVGFDGSPDMWDPILTLGDDFVGTLSARLMEADGFMHLSNLEDFLGPFEGTLDGIANADAGGIVSIDFAVENGPLHGEYHGAATTNQSSTTFSGTFTLAQPGCTDNFGSHGTGLFTLTAPALTKPNG